MRDAKRGQAWPGPSGGAGYISIFTTYDVFVQCFATGGNLNAPRGIVPTPANFGLVFDNGSNNAKTTALCFTAGPNQETAGILREFEVNNEKSQSSGMPGMY